MKKNEFIKTVNSYGCILVKLKSMQKELIGKIKDPIYSSDLHLHTEIGHYLENNYEETKKEFLDFIHANIKNTNK